MKVRLGRFSIELPLPEGWQGQGSLILENVSPGIAANIRLTWKMVPQLPNRESWGSSGMPVALESLITEMRSSLQTELGKPVRLIKSEPLDLQAGAASMAEFDIELSPEAKCKHLVLVASLERSIFTVGCTWPDDGSDSPFSQGLHKLLRTARFDPF